MNSILKQLQEPKSLQSYIDDNMKTSTYKALWKNEMKDVSYCAAKVYMANIAAYTAAMAGSVIAKNAERPVHTMPDFGQLTGSIARIGDEWELDDDYLEQLHLLEGKFKDMSGSGNYTQSSLNAEFDKLIAYSFKPFEIATISPHKRMDMLYFEGLFKGTQTVSRKNNSKANVSYTFDLGIETIKPKVKWGQSNATVFADLKALKDKARMKGRSVLRVRMSENTFYKMCQSDEVKNTFKLNLGTVQLDASVPMISTGQMNTYLRSILLPTIEIEEDKFVDLPDGSTMNLIPDDRVVAMCADKVAVPKCAQALEAIDPVPNVSYATYDDNLVGYWRDKEGYHLTNEMWMTPVFDGLNDFFIMDVSQQQD